MVSVVQLHPQNGAAALADGLARAERDLLGRALEFAEPLYAGQALSTGEPVWPHALGLASSLAAIGADPAARAAGVLFAAPKYLPAPDALAQAFGAEIAALAAGVERLYQLRVLTRATAAQQSEALRKMLLGMVEDVRVVLVRLASRTQTLRWFAKHPGAERAAYARETLDIYAPLANRLGVWQLKWELEDLSFRFLEPETYQRIARMLDERRVEREQYIAQAVATLERELAAAGVAGTVSGRPKHIYSIWTKMRVKGLDFEQLHDVRALRVIVPAVKDCYAALGVAHNLWQPIEHEFDDYISRPKENLYQSLHTAVLGPAGKTLEVQIRTEEMHRHAELGVAAHWRYKEAGRATRADTAHDDKIAWLRQLLAWRDEVADRGSWAERTRAAALDDTIYVVTPQGKVVDLPAGATPVDFAYALHTDLGHRCRGAKVDGRIVPLDTPLKSGQRVEISVAKTGGPSRDWLNAERGFLKTSRARAKVRHWFNLQEGGRESEAPPRPRLVPPPAAKPAKAAKKRTGGSGDGGILVVGMDRLLTQIARCCKPVPPDPIRGFVTRGRGVSIHRADCPSLKRLEQADGGRLLDAQWGAGAGAYGVDMVVAASDRPGLLRDIGDALAREHLNVTAVRTQSRDELAYMRFSFAVTDLAQLRRASAAVREVPGVLRVARG